MKASRREIRMGITLVLVGWLVAQIPAAVNCTVFTHQPCSDSTRNHVGSKTEFERYMAETVKQAHLLTAKN
jgi:hypothetical protein